MRHPPQSTYVRRRREAAQCDDAARAHADNEKLVAVLDRAVDEMRSARELAQSQERGRNSRDWLIFFIVAVAAASAVWLWLGMREQQKIMLSEMDQMQAEARPWISSEIVLAGPLTFDGQHAMVNVKVTLENSGSTPANNISSQPQIVAQSKSQTLNTADVLDNRCPTPGWRTDMVYGDSLFKDQSVERVIAVTADRKSINAHEGDPLMLLDCVYYQLPGGAIRKTASAYLMVGASWRDRKDSIARDGITLYPQGGFAR